MVALAEVSLLFSAGIEGTSSATIAMAPAPVRKGKTTTPPQSNPFSVSMSFSTVAKTVS